MHAFDSSAHGKRLQFEFWLEISTCHPPYEDRASPVFLGGLAPTRSEIF